MDEKLIQELLDEFIPTLESLEAQSTAALQFLKDQGKTNGKKLAPYLEDAAKAGNVRWLAVRLRLNHLISSAMKAEERAEQDSPKKEKPLQLDKEPKEMAAQDKEETNPEKETFANEEESSSEQKAPRNTENKTNPAKEGPHTEAA